VWLGQAVGVELATERSPLGSLDKLQDFPSSMAHGLFGPKVALQVYPTIEQKPDPLLPQQGSLNFGSTESQTTSHGSILANDAVGVQILVFRDRAQSPADFPRLTRLPERRRYSTVRRYPPRWHPSHQCEH
jgi:hypothetical protein